MSFEYIMLVFVLKSYWLIFSCKGSIRLCLFFRSFIFSFNRFLRSSEWRWGSLWWIFHKVFIHFPLGGDDLIFSLGQLCCYKYFLPCAKICPGHVREKCWVQGHAHCPAPLPSPALVHRGNIWPRASWLVILLSVSGILVHLHAEKGFCLFFKKLLVFFKKWYVVVIKYIWKPSSHETKKLWKMNSPVTTVNRLACSQK